ncbi:hypothetical protein FB451DRAFT_1191309 [Mycena latifolia]|nr:hypothetical protein FB451DRAFT_1191309 [Mycena latifolia]
MLQYSKENAPPLLFDHLDVAVGTVHVMIFWGWLTVTATYLQVRPDLKPSCPPLRIAAGPSAAGVHTIDGGDRNGWWWYGRNVATRLNSPDRRICGDSVAAQEKLTGSGTAQAAAENAETVSGASVRRAVGVRATCTAHNNSEVRGKRAGKDAHRERRAQNRAPVSDEDFAESAREDLDEVETNQAGMKIGARNKRSLNFLSFFWRVAAHEAIQEVESLRGRPHSCGA